MAKAKPKFKVGDDIEYPEDTDSRFGPGFGKIHSIGADTDGGGFHYEVKDADGDVLPVLFPEDELKRA
jgi:hypothetical protein